MVDVLLVPQMINVCYQEVMTTIGEVRITNRLVENIKKCIGFLGKEIKRLPKDLDWEIVKEIVDLLKNIKNFISCFKDQSWFKRYLWKRMDNKINAALLLDQLFRLNYVLQTKLQMDMKMSFEDFRRDQELFQKQVIENLERLREPEKKKERDELGLSIQDLVQLQNQTKKSLVVGGLTWHIPQWKMEIEKEIGKGGFGTVYHGKYEGMDVAVKKTTGSFGLNRNSLADCESFRKELEIVIGLRHENVVRVYGGAVDPEVYIVMQYCEFGSIYSIISNPETYTVQDVHRLTWAKQLTCGLTYLHSNRILHRDIKSMNALVDKFGVAKWGDFGLASKHSSRTFSNDNNGYTGGTEMWSPPEAFQGEYNQRSESWGLGLIIFHMIEGECPFQNCGPRLIRAFIADCNLDFTWRSKCAPEVLQDAMKQCLRVENKERPMVREVHEILRKDTSTKAMPISTFLGELLGKDHKVPRSFSLNATGNKALYAGHYHSAYSRHSRSRPNDVTRQPDSIGKKWTPIFHDGVKTRATPRITAEETGEIRHGETLIVLEELRDEKEHWIMHEKGWCCARVGDRSYMHCASGASSNPPNLPDLFQSSVKQGLNKALSPVPERPGRRWRVVTKRGVMIRTEPRLNDKNYLETGLPEGSTVLMIEEIVEEEHWIRHNAGWSLARGRDGRCLMQPVMDSGFHSNLDENQDLSSSSSEQKVEERENLPYCFTSRVWKVAYGAGVNIRTRPTGSSRKKGEILCPGESVLMLDQKIVHKKGKAWIKHARGWSCVMRNGKWLLKPLQRTVVSDPKGKRRINRAASMFNRTTKLAGDSSEPDSVESMPSSKFESNEKSEEYIWQVTTQNGVYVRSKPCFSSKPVGGLSETAQAFELERVRKGKDIWIRHISGWSCVNKGDKVFMQRIKDLHKVVEELGVKPLHVLMAEQRAAENIDSKNRSAERISKMSRSISNSKSRRSSSPAISSKVETQNSVEQVDEKLTRRKSLKKAFAV